MGNEKADWTSIHGLLRVGHNMDSLRESGGAGAILYCSNIVIALLRFTTIDFLSLPNTTPCSSVYSPIYC